MGICTCVEDRYLEYNQDRSNQNWTKKITDSSARNYSYLFDVGHAAITC